MQITITQWGNSLAVRIPKIFANQAGIKQNEKVELKIKDDQIILSKPKPSLRSLLKKVTPKNIHKETKTGKVIGKEIW